MTDNGALELSAILEKRRFKMGTDPVQAVAGTSRHGRFMPLQGRRDTVQNYTAKSPHHFYKKKNNRLTLELGLQFSGKRQK